MATATGCVATCTVQDASAVVQMVTELFPEGGYLVLEKVTDVQFVVLDKAKLCELLQTCEGGRVFARQAEVRWQRTGQGTFAMLLLTENVTSLSPSWKQRCDLAWRTDRGQVIRLWGERKAGQAYWGEARIPRRLNYPVAKQEGVVHVKCIVYYDKHGTARFTRFQEVR